VTERRLDGAAVANYVHGARLDEILAIVAPTATSYPLHDGLGSAMALTDAKGVVTERYRYDPFGTPVMLDASYQPRTASAFGNRFLFTGREWRQELGAYEYRSRYYSPAFARFASPDSVRFAGGINLYAYCGNQPVSVVDPYGTDWGFGFCTYTGGDTWSKRWQNCFQSMTGIQTSSATAGIAGATTGVASGASTVITTYGAQSVSTVVGAIATDAGAAAAGTVSVVDGALVAGATVVKAATPIVGAMIAAGVFGIALGCIGTATVNP
jgi:RHS repeat-associated protein